MEGYVTVVGSIVTDLTFYSKTLPKNGQTLEGNLVEGLGGKGFNQAISCSKVGAPTHFISSVGVDSRADQFDKALVDSNIQRHVYRSVDHPTGAAAILVDATGTNQIVVSLGANKQLTPAWVEADTSLANSAVVLAQFETNMESVIAAFSKASIATKILNPAPAYDIPDELLKLTDILTPNETELEAISGYQLKGKSGLDYVTACSKIPHVPNIIVTLGEHGCLHYKRDGTFQFYDCPKVEAVDTSGAGDAFNGAFAGCLLRYKDIPTAIKHALIVASISVTKPGTSASIPAEAEVMKFIAAHFPSEYL